MGIMVQDSLLKDALENTSHSRQKTLMRCPKKFQYHYINGVRPKRDDDRFLLGRAVHKFLEEYYRSQISSDRITAYQAAVQSFEQYTDENFPDDENAQAQYELAKGMINNYHNWASKNDNFTVIETEVEYELKIANSIDRGIWDGLIEVGGEYWIMEHKTYKQMKAEHTLRDQQISKYVLAASKHGIPVRGVMYNILRKAVPQKPALLKSGKLSKALNSNITYDSYMEAVQELGHDPESYADILDKLKEQENNFIYREFVPRTVEQSRETLKDVQQVESLKYYMIQNNIFPRNDTKDCSWDCPFNDLCLAELEGRDLEQLVEEKYTIVTHNT